MSDLEQSMQSTAQTCLTQIRKGTLTRETALDLIHELAAGDAAMETYGSDLLNNALLRGARSVT